MSAYKWKKVMKAKEVIGELTKNDWVFITQSGSHKKYRKNNVNCTVADHGSNNIPAGTLNSIKKSVTLAEGKDE